MKPSDFVSTSGQKQDMSQSLLQTEMTDAVNSGIVGRADKSEKSLKSGLYSVGKKASTGGATSAALAAVTKSHGGRKDSTSTAIKNNVINGALSDSELEGADTVYYGGKGTYRAVRGIQKRIAGKDALSSKKSLGKLSEKKSQSKSMDTLEAKRKAQAKGYFKKTVYDTAEKVKAAAVAEKTIGGKVLVSKGGSGLLMSVAPIILPVLIMAMLVIILFLGILGGIAGDDAQKKASLDGMPSWVTYDLVLSCLKAHEEYGYPPSALLGQMMIENGTSDEGSDLGRLYHNYGGVKYFGTIDGLITGSVSMLTTEYINGRPVQMYCNFAVFASDAAYMKYRCEYLYKQPNYTSVPNFQKAIDEKNSELFLKALGEGGYYTASTDSYVAQYRSICEAYPLVPRLDSMTSEEFENGFGNAFYPGGGQDYASAEQWQKDIVNACSRVSWPGASLCATWTSRVYAAAGHPCSGNGNSVLGHQGYGASYYPSRATTDLSQIKVGMLVSAQFGSNTAAGNTYGHVGIYIGDGMVMDSVNSGIRTISLSEWVSQNGRGWVVCGYPWDWR